jgi:hypothetical protein
MKQLLASLLVLAAVASQSWAATCTIRPDQPKQKIWGIGFEIQSDSIGSGNHGLPEEPVAVPHDLVPAERERLAKEMLKGFRYCRLAGGLYWRGLDPEGKFLRPRWPSQLEELKQVLDLAGVEGICLEYWSPAPYWKANRSYVGLGGPDGRALNRLRCLAPGFDKDPDYRGDTNRFLADFANAVVTDIRTLEAAGLPVRMFGLQNEPNVNHTIYSTCHYPESRGYIDAYKAVAGAIRRHSPRITLFADTESGYPKLIGPGMKDPEVASLVDAYAVHIVGSPSETPRKVHEKIRAQLPVRPWFQNEYEYLTGGATPDRCLNTVQHIMNSFQLAENPTWFWIHALKPIGNAEASGYALGFWRSLILTSQVASAETWMRWPGGPQYRNLPADLRKAEVVAAKFKPGAKPAVGYTFIVNQPVTVHLAAEPTDALQLDPAWQRTTMKLEWDGGTDVVFKREFPKGNVTIPAPAGNVSGRAPAPHLAFVTPSEPATFHAQVGVNMPIEIRSQALEMARKTDALRPGHWVANPYNWHAVGSFVRRMPWDSVALHIDEPNYDANARLFAFRRPDGRVTIVLSNRSADSPRAFDLATGLDRAKWKGSRYTPDDAGKNLDGIPAGERSGAAFQVTLPPRSWEFWEQQ